jgi:hypothetical protein
VFGRSEEEPSPQERLSGHTGATTTAVDQPAGDGPSGPREGLILLLFALLTIAAAAFVLWSEEQSAADDPAGKAARGEVRGLDDLSMLREKNLRRVLEEVSDGDRPLVRNIRIEPGRVDVQVANADGSAKILSFDPAFEVTERDFGVSVSRSVPASKIDASGPERMLRGVAERSGLDTDAVDYATATFLIEDASTATWFMAMKEGPADKRQWTAEPDGRDVRRPGELSRAQERENARRQREIEQTVKRQQRRSKQLSNCLRKATSSPQFTRCFERYQG